MPYSFGKLCRMSDEQRHAHLRELLEEHGEPVEFVCHVCSTWCGIQVHFQNAEESRAHVAEYEARNGQNEGDMPAPKLHTYALYSELFCEEGALKVIERLRPRQ